MHVASSGMTTLVIQIQLWGSHKIYMKVPSLAMMFVASFIVRCGCVRNFGPAMLVTYYAQALGPTNITIWRPSIFGS